MGRPAARVSDMTVCPMFSGTVPHVGGPIIPPCQTNVLTCGMPQARVSDRSLCATGGLAKIITGATTVLVGGKPAARIGDSTNHGGRIVTGCVTVLIGNANGGGAGIGAGVPRPDPFLADLPTLSQASADAMADELKLDMAILAADLTGIVDPSPTSDLVSGTLSLYQRDYLGAVISVASMIPYIGDVAKIGKLAKLEKTAEKAVSLLKSKGHDGAKAARATIGALRRKLGEVPLERLPAGARQRVESLKHAFDDALLTDLAKQGHGPQRHEGQVTREQLERRSLTGELPNGTTPRYPNGEPNIPRSSTRVKSPSDYVNAENHLRYSDEFDSAEILNDKKIVRVQLEEVFGSDYLDRVEGATRIGSKNNPLGVEPTDLTGGNMIGRYQRAPDGSWNLITMYPEKAK